MLFDTLIYRCILKARAIAPKDSKRRIKLNGAVHYLIDKCFFNNQLMVIRRLTDKNGDVVSLRKLLQQMKGNCKHLTRRNYFEVLKDRGYEYDYSETKKKHAQYIAQNLEIGEVIVIPSELDWERSETLHAHFDKLSETKPTNRKPEDIIKNSIFDRLLDELDSCEGLRHYIDCFLAHSLTAEKIGKRDEERFKVTFGRLWRAQQSICKVTKFIGLHLLEQIDYGLLPLPHATFLRYIEEPLIPKDAKAQLRREEEQFRQEISSWKTAIGDLCDD
jgi:hypothetical protein